MDQYQYSYQSETEILESQKNVTLKLSSCKHAPKNTVCHYAKKSHENFSFAYFPKESKFNLRNSKDPIIETFSGVLDCK